MAYGLNLSYQPGQTLQGREAEQFMRLNPGYSYQLFDPVSQSVVANESQRPDGILGILDSVAAGVARPFYDTMTGTAEQLRYNALPTEDRSNYKSQYMLDSDFKDYLDNPFLRNAQNAAGIASWMIPGVSGAGKFTLGNLGRAVGAGALGGGLQGFSQTDTSKLASGDFSDVLKGAGLGGAIGGAFYAVPKGFQALTHRGPYAQAVADQTDELTAEGLKRLKGNQTDIQGGTKLSNKIRQFGDDQQMAAFRRRLGGAAPKTQGGALLERDFKRLADQYHTQINSIDDALNFTNQIYDDLGNVTNQAADDLTQQGTMINVDDLISPLQDKADDIALGRLKKPYLDVINEIKNASGGTGQITPRQALDLRREMGNLGKWKHNPFAGPDVKSTADAFEEAYKVSNDVLDDVFSGSGYTNFRDVNKTLSIARKGEMWMMDNLAKQRPGAFINDPIQDFGLGSAILTQNPLAYIPGTIAGKYIHSPSFQNLIGKGATGLANTIDDLAGVSRGMIYTADDVARIAAQQGDEAAAAISSAVTPNTGFSGMDMSQLPSQAGPDKMGGFMAFGNNADDLTTRFANNNTDDLVSQLDGIDLLLNEQGITPLQRDAAINLKQKLTAEIGRRADETAAQVLQPPQKFGAFAQIGNSADDVASTLQGKSVEQLRQMQELVNQQIQSATQQQNTQALTKLQGMQDDLTNAIYNKSFGEGTKKMGAFMQIGQADNTPMNVAGMVRQNAPQSNVMVENILKSGGDHTALQQLADQLPALKAAGDTTAQATANQILLQDPTIVLPPEFAASLPSYLRPTGNLPAFAGDSSQLPAVVQRSLNNPGRALTADDFIAATGLANVADDAANAASKVGQFIQNTSVNPLPAIGTAAIMNTPMTNLNLIQTAQAQGAQINPDIAAQYIQPPMGGQGGGYVGSPGMTPQQFNQQYSTYTPSTGAYQPMGGGQQVQLPSGMANASQADAMYNQMYSQPKFDKEAAVYDLLSRGATPREALAEVSAFEELMGLTPAGSKSIGGSDLRMNSNINAGLRAADTIEQIINQDNTALTMTNLPEPLRSSNAKQLSAATSNLSDVIGRLRSGGQVGPVEEARFRSLLPTMWDDSQTTQYKLQQVRQMLNEALVQGGGQDSYINQAMMGY